MLDFGITGRLFRLCEVVMRLAYVNLLWILFTVLGLGLFGIFPATVALFAVTRKWVMGDHDIPIFSTFWHTYRKEFFKSTLLGFILFVIGYIIYVDLMYLPTGGLYDFVRLGIVVCGFLYIIMMLYIFPIYVHFDWKHRLYIKYALLLGASHPHFTLLMIIGIGAWYYLVMSIPGLIPFFSVSILAYIMMWTVYLVVKRLEMKQEEAKVKTASKQEYKIESSQINSESIK